MKAEHAPPAALPLPAPLPLYVDLDGSLIRSDLLLESALLLLKRGVFKLVSMLLWVLQGKSVLKSRIAAVVQVDARLLPYNTEVLAFLQGERASGRRLILATASHRRYADAVAQHLDLFDGVIATDEHKNLSGRAKLAAIRDDAAGPFAYLGNAGVDLAIWQESAAAVVVAGPALARRAARVCPLVRVIDPGRAGPVDWARAFRLHQWAKNLLLLLPAMPLMAELQRPGWLALLLAFLAFGLCASSVYLLNDLLDIESDRAHPRKRHRPIPSGRIPVIQVCLLIPPLLAAAFGLALAALPWPFLWVLMFYWGTTLAYSFTLKRRVLVDVMTLAMLYTLRILAGSAAIMVAPSFWILVFSMFLFLSLAAAKRYVELRETQRRDLDKVSGRGYLVSDIPFVLALGVASGLVSVMILALYVNDPVARQHLHNPHALWPICPLMLYWILRVWLKASRGELHDDPVVFAVTDRISQIAGLASLGMVALAAHP